MGHEGDRNRTLFTQHVSTFPGELSKSLNQLELTYTMHRHSLSASLYMWQCMEEVYRLSIYQNAQYISTRLVISHY